MPGCQAQIRPNQKTKHGKSNMGSSLDLKRSQRTTTTTTVKNQQVEHTLTEYNSHVTPSDLGRSGDKWLNGCCNRLVGDMFWCVSHFRHSLDLRRVSSAFSWSRFCSLQELIDRSLTTSEAVPGDRKQRKQRSQLVETTNYHQLSNATDTKRHKKNQ